MSRSLAPCLIAATLILAASSFAVPASATQEPGAAPETKAPPAAAHRPMPKPSNLQVFPKDIPPAELMNAMHAYTHDLGVECSFCHAEDPQTHRLNFASDAKDDKTIARTMIAMTQEINAKYLSTVKDPDATPADKTVTCGTCHRGEKMPSLFKGTGGMGSMHHDPAPAASAPKPQ